MPPQWIFGLVGLAVALGFGVLFHRGDATIGASIISLAQSIITGAFGIAVGHSLASRTNPKDLPPGSLSQTTETVQTPPVTVDSTSTTGAN